MSSTSADSYSAPDGRRVTLRPADHADHAAVTALLRSLELPTEGVVDWLARYWVACSDAVVVGVAGMEHYGDAGLLRSVAVTPEWQGSGVGRALIDRVLEAGRTRGVRDVYLLTTTAEHYFPRLGFACITRDQVPGAVQASVEFTGACPSSAVVMQKRLTED
jgi:N-acetylglutamate synthase-like GNAT family acetyltransferase